MIGAVGALLHRIDQQWFIFSGIFLFSAFLFILVQRRPSSTPASRASPSQAEIEIHENVLALGDYWDVPSASRPDDLRIELIEVTDENHATLHVSTSSIL